MIALGADTTTGSDWRNPSVIKPNDPDGDPVFGTDGFLLLEWKYPHWNWSPRDRANDYKVLPDYIASISDDYINAYGDNDHYGRLNHPFGSRHHFGRVASSKQWGFNQITIERNGTTGPFAVTFISTYDKFSHQIYAHVGDEIHNATQITFSSVPNQVRYATFLIPAGLQPVILREYSQANHCSGIAFDGLSPYPVESLAVWLDQLAREGMLFEQFYCQYPVCGPSRFSVLTGLRPNTSGIYGNYGNEPIWPETVQRITTMLQHFKKNGYHTVSIGKVYHVPRVQDIEGWSEMSLAIGTHNYLHPGNIEMQELKRQEAKAKGLTDWDYRGALLVVATEDANVADDEYYDGQHANMAIEKIRELKDAPFFMALGFFRPHMPFIASKRYWDLYSPEQIRLADNPFPPKNAPECALHNNFEPRAYGDVPDEGPFSERLQRRLIHGYYACVSYLDTLVGKVLDELERLGLRDKTTIIFWGDNGFHLGDHDLWGKFTNFETSAHCPLIISDPEIKYSGARSAALTEYIDLYPTICNLTGLPIPEHLEGISMMPLLENPEHPWKRAAFSQFS